MPRPEDCTDCESLFGGVNVRERAWYRGDCEHLGEITTVYLCARCAIKHDADLRNKAELTAIRNRRKRLEHSRATKQGIEAARTRRMRRG